MSWTEAGTVDLVDAELILEVASGRKVEQTTTYVSTRRRKKKPAPKKR